MAEDEWGLEQREPTEREKFFEEAHKQFVEKVKRVDAMMLAVVKAQVTVEQALAAFLEAHGKNPKHFLYTKNKIIECKKIDPPEVSRALWDLFEFCTHVRNELVHSLDDAQITAKTQKVREAYIAMTGNERQKQGIRDMNDAQMITSAIYHLGSYIVVATDNWEESKKKP
jgi:hypothetical protein